MERIWLVGFVLAALALAAEAHAERGDDSDHLSGTWGMVSGEKAGKEAPERDAQALVLIIKDNTLTFSRGEHREMMKLSLDPTTSPKQLNLTSAEDKLRPGIYEIAGDTLKICLSGTDERPKDFASTKSTRNALMVLERKKE